MQHTRSVWVRGPGQDSTFWGVPDYLTRPGTLPLPFWGDCAACPTNDVKPTSVTVPARPPFSPNGIFARPMYGDPQFGFAGKPEKVLFYGIILAAGLLYLNSTRKKKPDVTAYRRILGNPKKMKLGGKSSPYRHGNSSYRRRGNWMVWTSGSRTAYNCLGWSNKPGWAYVNSERVNQS